MDRIKNKRELLYSDISEKIIGCCFDVMKELGSGYLELEYKRLHHPNKFIELEEYDKEPLSFFKQYAEDKALDSSSCPS